VVKPVCLHAKDEIETFLRGNAFLHLYAIGDLDDFFWPYTTWYAIQNQRGIEALALFYTGMPLPILLALADEPTAPLTGLLRSISHLLPRRFYAHLSGDLATVFAGDYHAEPYGLHHKMALTDPACLDSVDTSAVIPLSVADLPDVQAFYQASHPDNAFDPRMLETGCYYGIRQGTELVSVAGIHVYSPQYRVAALGNVVTRPDCRGRGLATAVCARLCRALLAHVDQIGLNVKADNAAAIACYRRLGFATVAPYGEYMFELKQGR
jgi:GNAT superfamily N-acetyltransferase